MQPQKIYSSLFRLGRAPASLLDNLAFLQKGSFERFKTQGIQQIFRAISPLVAPLNGAKVYFPDGSPTAESWGLGLRFEPPRQSHFDALYRGETYAGRMFADVLVILPGGAPKKTEILLGNLPEVTEYGTVVINGVEKVAVSQLLRAPGVYFNLEQSSSTGEVYGQAQIIPSRGGWFGMEVDEKTGRIVVRFDRRRGVPLTDFMRALLLLNDHVSPSVDPEGVESVKDLLVAGAPDEVAPQIAEAVALTEEQGDGCSAEKAVLKLFKVMNGRDAPNADVARDYLQARLYDFQWYDLSSVGRHRLIRELPGATPDPDYPYVSRQDFASTFHRLIMTGVNRGPVTSVDDLSNKIVRGVGDILVQEGFSAARKMAGATIQQLNMWLPGEPFDIKKIIYTSVFEDAFATYFNIGPLAQFMDQTNPLSELRHKRTMSALGPGGLTRDSAGIDSRDVNKSHYGRICPVETPEGPNIGLVTRLGVYARLNEHGFILTPYWHILQSLPAGSEDLAGRELSDDVLLPEGGVIISRGEVLTPESIKAIRDAGVETVPVVPFVSQEITYLNPAEEKGYRISPAILLNGRDELPEQLYTVRHKMDYGIANRRQIDFMDLSSYQMTGVSAGLVPFIGHCDGHRALMASNMMSQAVPLLRADPTRVGTGLERLAPQSSSQVLISRHDGVVLFVDSGRIVIRSSGEDNEYKLRKFEGSNQETCISQRPCVARGDVVAPGDVIADSFSTINGELALGQDVVVAFVCRDGLNYEDAIVLSERLVKDDKFSSVEVFEIDTDIVDTPNGPEEISRESPGVSNRNLDMLDARGIVKIGAIVHPNDALVAKRVLAPPRYPSPHDSFISAVFEDDEPRYRGVSLRLPHGREGRVIGVRVIESTQEEPLGGSILSRVIITIAELQKMHIGDKMSGRHGNKGVVSIISPEEDMPFLEDGTPVDVVLNPLGVPGRMNFGQILEMHLGVASHLLGYRCVVPAFDSTGQGEIEAELARLWLMEEALRCNKKAAFDWLAERGEQGGYYTDDDHIALTYAQIQLKDDGVNPGRMFTDEVYARRSILHAWLNSMDVDHDQIMAYEDAVLSSLERNTRGDMAIITALRIWLSNHGVKEETDDIETMKAMADKVMIQTGDPHPLLGMRRLRDGVTGEEYEAPVAVGRMTMLKLNHMAAHKAHGRSVGPYSMTTQQPLGGKAMEGGQRLGEMEVWALEGHGAAYALQEALTLKSDDVLGRNDLYESVISGLPVQAPEIPSSFVVLGRELQGLGFSLSGYYEDGTEIDFGIHNRASLADIQSLVTGKLGKLRDPRTDEWRDFLRQLELPKKVWRNLAYNHRLPETVNGEAGMWRHLASIASGQTRLPRFGVIYQNLLNDALLKAKIRNS